MYKRQDVDLVEMRDAAVARGYGYVFELDVHVVFGCEGEACVSQSGGNGGGGDGSAGRECEGSKRVCTF